MDPSRTYLSLKLKHMHAIRGAFLTSSPILRKTNMGPVRMGRPALELPQHPTSASAPRPARLQGPICGAGSAELLVPHLKGQEHLNSN